MQQIAMRALQFDQIKAEPVGASRGGGKGISDAGEPFLIERLRCRPIVIEGNRRRGNSLPRAFCDREGLAAFPRYMD
jgi:hypothetical protein